MLGHLNFASQFVTDYKRRIHPLYALTRKSSAGVWKREHTDLLNEVVDKICNRLRLGLVDMSKGVRIHVGLQSTEHGADVACVMTQGEGDMYSVVAMYGRELTATERGRIELEQWLVAACWAVKRMARYTMYLPRVELAVPSAALLAVLRSRDLHCAVQALVIEL